MTRNLNPQIIHRACSERVQVLSSKHQTVNDHGWQISAKTGNRSWGRKICTSLTLISCDWTWPHLLDELNKGIIVLTVTWHAEPPCVLFIWRAFWLTRLKMFCHTYLTARHLLVSSSRRRRMSVSQLGFRAVTSLSVGCLSARQEEADTCTLITWTMIYLGGWLSQETSISPSSINVSQTWQDVEACKIAIWCELSVRTLSEFKS